MTVSLKLDAPDSEHRADHLAQGVLGTGAARLDGPLKVTGGARYAADAAPPGLAHGVLKRAPGQGRVRLGNRDEVAALPGVLAVIHDPAMIRNSAQGTANKAPVQGVEEAFYAGQPVALVVAESFEIACRAAHLLRVEVSGAAGPVDPLAVAAETPADKQVARGDLDAAMAQAAHGLDEIYTTPPMASAAMEPHAALAWWEGGRLTVRCALQMLKYNRNELADSLGIDPADVRLLAPHVGGGFGSKLGVSADAVAAAIAARDLGRPVRVVQSRRQVFEATTHRAATRQRIRLAAGADGRLAGLGHEALVYNLPGEVFSEPVTQATHFAYAAANRVIGHHIARVHRPATGSVRAPGEAVGVTAFELAMDELAGRAGIDPVALRLRNIPERDPERGVPFSSHRLAAALTEAAGAFGWQAGPRRPRQRREGEWWIGAGMAAAFRVNMQMEAEARIRLSAEGAVVESDMTDIGTGSYTILGQIAGELLGLPLERVTVVLGDTALPPGSGSGGSFGAASTGGSVWLAAMELRRQLAARLGCAEPALVLRDGVATAGNRRRGLAELLRGETLTGHGHLLPGEAATRVRQATYGAYFAEVAVSAVTGEVRARRMLGRFAAGRILNPRTARSQCLGGMIWGIGMALTEAMLPDRRDGHMVNRDLAQYHLPTHADVPEMDVGFIEERDDWVGPMQAKGLGELGICGAGAAVLNAVHDACGARVRSLPATPDRVLAAMP